MRSKIISVLALIVALTLITLGLYINQIEVLSSIYDNMSRVL